MERVERMPGVFARTRGSALDVSTRVQPLVLAPLLLRLPLAAVFFAHGAQKLFGVFGGQGLQGTAAGFAAMGLKPALFLAIVAALLETVGGLLLLAGVWTRAVAALLGFEMLFALFAVHAQSGFFLNWACTPPTAGHGMEYSLTLVGALAALSVLGGGRASVDSGLRKRSRRLFERERVPEASTTPMQTQPPATPTPPKA